MGLVHLPVLNSGPNDRKSDMPITWQLGIVYHECSLQYMITMTLEE